MSGAGRYRGAPGSTPEGRWGGAAGPLRAELARLLGTRRVEVEEGGATGEIAVIRVGAETLPLLLAPGVRGAAVERARAAGFRWAALDLALPDARGTVAPGEAGGPAAAAGAPHGRPA